MSKINETRRRVDRRIVRTRQLLREALLALISEKGYDGIRVLDIAERANLNRATFYLHYRDKSDLLLQSSEDVFNDLATRFEPITKDNLALDKPPIQLQIVFEHVAQHADFYRVILGKDGVPAFAAKLREYIAAISHERVDQLHALFPDAAQIIDSRYVANYVAGALVGTITWWLETGMPHSSDFMADRFAWLTIAGCYPMLGLTPPTLDG